MRILIDAQALQTDSGVRGIGRYVDGLLSALPREGVEVFALINAEPEESAVNAMKRLRKYLPESRIVTFHPVGNYNSRNFGGLDYFLSEAQYVEAVRAVAPDIYLNISALEVLQKFIFPPPAQLRRFCRTALIIHDLIPLAEPEKYLADPKVRDCYFHLLSRVDGYDKIFCNSNFSRDQLHQIKPWIDAVTIEGAAFASPVPALPRGDFIFYCGGTDPRKNVPFLVDAYGKTSEAFRRKHPLCICCRKGNHFADELQKQIDAKGLTPFARLVEADTDEDLAKWYASCWLFVFPSLCEGLGLPILEAYNYGAPMIASPETSLKEFYDFAEGQFDPRNLRDLAEKLERCDRDPAFYEAVKAYSASRKGAYSWEKVADRCLKTFGEMLQEGKASGSVDPQNLSGVTLLPALNTAYQQARLRQRRITLYVDVSYFWTTKLHTGIQRVVANFNRYAARSLEGLNVDIAYITGTDNPNCYNVIKETPEGWTVVGQAEPQRGDCYVAIDLCPDVTVRLEGLMRRWKARGVFFFFFLHDIAFAQCPQFIANLEGVKKLDQYLRIVLSLSDGVMANSRSVMTEVQDWAKKEDIDASRIAFTYQHLGQDFNTSAQRKAAKQPGDKFHFLAVSTIEPRKGYNNMIDAFNAALDAGMKADLTIVGRVGWLCDDIKERLENGKYAGKSVVWERDCSDARLSELYALADCYVNASYYEGFGIGTVEAASYGVPLLLRDIPINRELADGHAVFFTEETLSEAFRSIAEGKTKLPDVAGMEILTWQESVDGMMRQFCELIRTRCRVIGKEIDKPAVTESAVWVAEHTPRAAATVVPSADASGAPGFLEECGVVVTAKDLKSYRTKNVRFALMRKLALTPEKRLHYDRKWRLLRRLYEATKNN